MFTVRLKGGERVQAALGKLGEQGPRALAAALFAEGEAIVAKAKELVPVDMGALRASGHVQPPEVVAGRVRVTLGFGGAGAPYALYVHEGTGPAVGRPPYFPPVKALEGWVRRNLRPREKDVRSLTFVIARAIGSRGTEPVKYLERPMREAESGMESRVARRLEQWLRRQSGAA